MAQQDSARHAWAVFLTAHAVLVEAVEERLAKAGLPQFSWYDLLWALERADDGRRRMHELADLVVQSRSNLTRLVDRLEKVRLVRRVPSEDDRRGAYAEAEKSLSLAADKAPNNATMRYHLGMTYARLGRKADAVSALRRAAQLDPR